MLFFTLCHINQLPNAILLGDTIRENHPSAIYFIGLIDKAERIPSAFQSPYRIVSVDELVIPDFETMAATYNTLELLNNTKPFFAKYALQQSDKVLYLDCTSVLFNPVDFISQDLNHYSIILVPQLLHAGVHPDEKQILNTGIYHSGFIGFKKSDETIRFLDWWGKNTTQKGSTNLCIGLNSDQLWLEHVPNFYDNVLLSKNNGINIGPWNLPERKIDASTNKVNGQPLISVNFKGMPYWPALNRKLKTYTLAPIEPVYGLSLPKENKTGKIIARNLRKINSLTDKIIDLLQ
ncbi:hypothetical protein [Emticicia sp. 21SJ11W-3]|uniref:hypothetical protein n=1 Tax=Emticicia sp. 21SJ11W-3 TaxID=2916755 RepID=UPI0020A121C2|nr:hypothetical protein [Emticicia sp. 21SJ11W-3]UTA70140.1 hypothetical protein MB380_10035 [Emticicia sp. 21SJ11W-3]